MKPVWVIKIGGAILSQPDCIDALMLQVKQLQDKVSIVLLHGGGEVAASWLTRLGYDSVKRNGLRVTPEEQLPYVVGALAGLANKQITAQAAAVGLNVVGLSLMDGGMCHCAPISEELGAVGSARPNQAGLLVSLLEQGYLPVVSSVGADASGQLLNVNADQAAISLCQLLGAELIFLSDVPGVMDQDKNLFSRLYPKQLKQLIRDGVITDGMVVKVNAALSAALSVQKPVTIASWQESQALSSIFNNQNSGTQICPMEL